MLEAYDDGPSSVTEVIDDAVLPRGRFVIVDLLARGGGGAVFF